MRFSGDDSLVLKGAGAFHRTDPFSFALWVRPGERREREVVFHRSRAWTDSGSRGYELLLEDGRPSFALVHFWPGNAIRVRAGGRSRPASGPTWPSPTTARAARRASGSTATESPRRWRWSGTAWRRTSSTAPMGRLRRGGDRADAGRTVPRFRAFKNGVIDQLKRF